MGNAGKIDFPTHMKDTHQAFLGYPDIGDLESHMVDAMNACLGASPYASMTTYDPTTQLSNMDTAVAAFNTRVDALDPTSDWEDAVDAVVAKSASAVFDDTYVEADITAFTAQASDRLVNTILPRFQGGLRDVNAVMSSAFVIGEAIIEAMNNHDVNKYAAENRLKFNIQRNDFILKGVESILRDIHAQVELEKNVAHYTLEAKRMRIAALKEKSDVENSIAMKDGRWDIETFQYGANLLASIGGGTMIPNGSDGPGTGQSVLAGALSGASIGNSAYGGGWGAVIGGILGGIGGLL